MKLIVLTLAAVTATALSAPRKLELPAETATLKPAPGAELVTAQCLVCHSVEYISTQPPLPRAYWQGSVKKMQEKFGAPIAAKDVDAIVDYLATHYGAPAAPLR